MEHATTELAAVGEWEDASSYWPTEREWCEIDITRPGQSVSWLVKAIRIGRNYYSADPELYPNCIQWPTPRRWRYD